VKTRRRYTCWVGAVVPGAWPEIWFEVQMLVKMGVYRKITFGAVSQSPSCSWDDLFNAGSGYNALSSLVSAPCVVRWVDARQQTCGSLFCCRFWRLAYPQSLLCGCRTWSLEQSVDGPQTAGLVLQLFHTVAEDVFNWAVGLERGVKPFNCALKTFLITY